jgi:hypothetical protein
MFSQRLQILVSPEQRRRLEAEAERRGTSVAAVIRDAVDRQLTPTSRADRLSALDAVRAMQGRFLSVDELERLVMQERTGATER